MTTTAERLVALAGSGSAGDLLRSLATVPTTGETLVAYSGLSSATAAEHLLAEVAVRTGGFHTLRRVTDARAFAGGVRATSYVGHPAVQGRFEFVPPVVIPSTTTVYGTRAGTRAGRPKFVAVGRAYAQGSFAGSPDRATAGVGQAQAHLCGVLSVTEVSDVNACAEAVAHLLGCVAVSTANDVSARGQKRLTPAKLASILAVVDSR